jgi:hypothetical protein
MRSPDAVLGQVINDPMDEVNLIDCQSVKDRDRLHNPLKSIDLQQYMY